MVHRLAALACWLFSLVGVGLFAQGPVDSRSLERPPSGAERPVDKTNDPPGHWAFQPPVKVSLPGSGGSSAPANPIDAFLAAARQERGLQASPPASKEVWLRRVYLDLIGLPPSREELRAFRADDSPDAQEKVVDRLLSSPEYGVRWGRHWMDIWRYSDWFGLGQELRFSHPHLWRWRDWIVESLNADKGYDTMLLEMLAGDELAPNHAEVLRATGFLARNWSIFNRNVILDQVVEHTGRGFLGLTFQCARCHDHKFDPISQVEYYQLRAFFEPYHVRVDRVAGEPDRTKAGLARAYDAFLENPTYVFERGDEARPRKSQPLRPAVPVALGAGKPEIHPLPLPLAASCPDKQDFVIQETLAAAEQAVVRACGALEQASQNVKETAHAHAVAVEKDHQLQSALLTATNGPDALKTAQAAAAQAAENLTKAAQAVVAAPGELKLAEFQLGLAEARQAALKAVLRIETIEDAKPPGNRTEIWNKTALETSALQRQLAVREAQVEQLQARQACERAERVLDGLTLATTVQKDNKPLRETAQKAAAGLVEARNKLAKTESQLAAAEQAAAGPPTTNYAVRPYAFPRAATQYRETPPNEPYPQISSGRRLALARWMTSSRQPLTARVAVNHIWLRHLGEPLVTPVFDFGLRTKRPLLHDLLDWLAVDLMESGWSMKRLHRQIVLSQAYRMKSGGGPSDVSNAQIDPDNRYFWRMNTRRMESEIVRDSLLQLAGKLDSRQGGPDLPVAQEETGTRRTIYYRYARDDRMRFLTFFDAPSVEECYRRHETIAPQQALVMANSKLVLTRAGEIAALIAREEDPRAPAGFVTSAFERVLGRAPGATELAQCEETLDALTAALRADHDPAPDARARAGLVHVLLNHNDFVTIR